MFVIGEHHDIIAYYNCDSESEEQLKPAFMALRARLERLGKLHELQFWVTDRCCEGGNPLEHWITKVFPAITRAPLKDRCVGKEPKTPSRYRKYDDGLRHAPVEVKLSDVRHPIVTPMSVRLLKRLAKSFGVSSNSRKCTELLVKEVAEAWRKQRPAETVIKLDPLPQPQPEAGASVLRAEASTTVVPNPASV